jgi:hypothetical protein
MAVLLAWLAWWCCCSRVVVDAGAATVDKNVLVDLYTATNGPRWMNNTGWRDSDVSDPCDDQWPGVQCDASSTTRNMSVVPAPA